MQQKSRRIRTMALVLSFLSMSFISLWPERVTVRVVWMVSPPTSNQSNHQLILHRKAANLLKPMLARGKLRCIGATTLAEYRRYIETDAALERRFAQVIVNEPSVAETISILRGIREKYEVHHGVRILDGALITAATLAHRYLTARRLPDSAIDLVDEACARYVCFILLAFDTIFSILSLSVRVTRETAPEAIDKLQRRKLELEVEIHALEREKDAASKERLQVARKAIAQVDEQLAPLGAAY